MTEQRPTKERVERLDKSNIHDASTSAIVAFAAKEAGLKFNEGASREYMISEIFEYKVPKAIDSLKMKGITLRQGLKKQINYFQKE